MNLKAAIAIILSLLFQWAAVAHCDVSSDGGVRFSNSPACDCCVVEASCPCASDESGVPGKPTLPVPPDPLKLPATKPGDRRVMIGPPPVLQMPHGADAHPTMGAIVGYAGVRLAVAFCSLVM